MASRRLVPLLSCFGKEAMNNTFTFAQGVLIWGDLQIRAFVIMAVAHFPSSPF